MTRPKGDVHEQVQRLRVKALEVLAVCFEKGGTGSDAIRAFGELCDQTEGGGMAHRLEDLESRVRDLETGSQPVGETVTREQGGLRMG